MTMNRRSLFGFLGGAVAAGPKLARDIAETASSHPPYAGRLYSSAAGGVGIGADPDTSWKVARIADLRRIIAGTDRQEEREKARHRLYEAETVERFRLDGLRSVSPAHKYSMLVAGQTERRDRIERMQASFELADLLAGKLG